MLSLSIFPIEESLIGDIGAAFTFPSVSHSQSDGQIKVMIEEAYITRYIKIYIYICNVLYVPGPVYINYNIRI